MWTLLKREIGDQAILFVLVTIAGIAFAGWMAGAFPSPIGLVPPVRVPDEIYAMFTLLVFTLAVGGGALAALQIVGDRTRGVSRFLCTLTVTRGQVLVSKWIAGLLWLALGIVPPASVCAILAHRWVQVIPVDTSPIAAIVSGTCLLALASYALGMQSVMARRPAWALLGSIVLAGGLPIVVLIKGYGLHTHLLAACVGLASLVRTWIRFQTMPL